MMLDKVLVHCANDKIAAYMYRVLKTSGCIQVLELVKIRMLSTHRINFYGTLPEQKQNKNE